jgi:hypothetical protein
MTPSGRVCCCRPACVGFFRCWSFRRLRVRMLVYTYTCVEWTQHLPPKSTLSTRPLANEEGTTSCQINKPQRRPLCSHTYESVLGGASNTGACEKGSQSRHRLRVHCRYVCVHGASLLGRPPGSTS